MIGRARRGTVVTTWAGALGLAAAGLALPGTASAVPGFAFDRIAGETRFATSAIVAEEYGAADTAILANGQTGMYADALSAAYLAGDRDAPVLLTRRGSTPEVVLDQLEESGVERVIVVGGTGVVSAGQVDALEDDGYRVSRLAGENRWGTNQRIIEESGPPRGPALVATGNDFADALAAGPLAEQGHPLALANGDRLPIRTIETLLNAGVRSALVVGGEAAVGPGVVDQLEDLGIDVVDRLAGDGRAGTSVAVAEYGVEELGLTEDAVDIASGDDAGTGADALSGGVLSGARDRPLLVTTDVDSPSAAVLGYLEERAETLTEGTIYGGTAAIADELEAELTGAAQGETTEPPMPPVTPDNGTADALQIVTSPDGLQLSGTSVRVDVELTDRGDPVAGERVRFRVVGEPGTRGALTAVLRTNRQGIATFTYTNTDGPGADTVTAAADSRDANPDLDLTDDVVVEFSDGIAALIPVAGEQRQFSSINSAMDAAQDDDTISATGVFGEDVVVVRDVTLTTDSATINGTLDVDLTRDANDQVVGSGEGATVSGFTVDADESFSEPSSATVIAVPDVTLSGVSYESTELVGITVDRPGAEIVGATFRDHRQAVNLNVPGTVITDSTFLTEDPEADVYVDLSSLENLSEDQLIEEYDAVLGADSGNVFEPPAAVDEDNRLIRPASAIVGGIGIRLEDGGGPRLVGTSATVAAEVKDAAGDLLPNWPVDLTVRRADGPDEDEVVETAQIRTDEAGIATFTYDNGDDGAGRYDIGGSVSNGQTVVGAAGVRVEFADGVATLTNSDEDVRTFGSISQALAVAVDGSRIDAVGTFEDAGTLTVSQDDLTLDGDGDATGTRARLDGSLLVTGDDVTVDGFTIEPRSNVDPDVFTDVDATGDGFTFTNNVYEGTAFQALILNGTRAVVRGNTFPLTGNVVVFTQESDVVIQDNTFVDDGDVIYVGYNSPVDPALVRATACGNSFSPPPSVLTSNDQSALLRPAIAGRPEFDCTP